MFRLKIIGPDLELKRNGKEFTGCGIGHFGLMLMSFSYVKRLCIS